MKQILPLALTLTAILQSHPELYLRSGVAGLFLKQSIKVRIKTMQINQDASSQKARLLPYS